MSKRISELTAGTFDSDDWLEVAQLSTSITMTSVNISAAAADNSLNDTEDGLVAAGFTAGSAIKISGFTGDTGNNFFSARMLSVAAGKIILSDDTALVNDSAGESVTLTQWITRRVDASELLTEAIIIACSDETTALATGTGKATFRMPYAFTLTGVRASLKTAQTSGSIFTVDINEAGTSVLSTKLTIDNTEKTSTTAATAAVISDTALADDAEITIDIDQVGDGTAVGLKVALIGYRT